MGYARYVGRVGALAVALGIGVAVTNNPAVASADDATSSTSSSSASSSPQGADAPSAPDRETDTDSEGTSPAPSAEPAPEDDDETDSPDTDIVDEDGDEPAESDDDSTPEDDVADDDSDSDDASGPTTDVTRPEAASSDRHEQSSAEKQELSEAEPAEDSTEAAEEPESETVRSVGRATEDVDTTAAGTPSPAATTLTAQTAAVVGSAVAANPIQTFVSSVLSWFGFAPQAAGTAPAAPAGNPAAWAILAWLRREFEYTLFNRSPVLDPVVTGQTTTGEVTGLLNGEDFQDADLTYSGTGTTPKGSVVVDRTTGAFTYTPGAELAATGGTDSFTVTASNTAAYRLPGLFGAIQGVIHQGAQFLGLAQSDTTRAVIEVSVDVNGLTVISEIRAEGTGFSPPVFSPDGTRAYRTTKLYNTTTGEHTTRLTVIDTITGSQLGSTIVVDGEAGDVIQSKDGTRVGLTTEKYDEATDTYTTTVVIVDAATGAVVGSRFVIEAQRAGHLQLTDDGTRAFQATQTFVDADRRWFTEITVIDTTSGTLVDTPIVLDGSFRIHSNNQLHPQALVFNTDGSRAYVHTQNLGSGVDATQPQKTYVAVIDTATGALVGTPITVDGVPAGPIVLSKDGTRAFAVTRVDVYFTNTATTRVAVLDAETGALIGSPLVLDGYAVESETAPDTAPTVFFSPDGSRAFVSTNVWNPVTFAETTLVSSIDAADGTLVTTTVLDGRARGTLQQSAADPTRFYQVTITDFGDRVEAATLQVATLRAVDGSLIGTAQTRGINDTSHPMVFSADGTRASLLTFHKRGLIGTHPDAQAAYLLIINTTTGESVGAPLQFNVATTVGGPSGATQFSQDGTRAFQLIDLPATVGQGWSTRLLVIDTTDGRLLNTVDLGGAPLGVMRVSDDGTRVYQTIGSRLVVVDATTGALVSSTNLGGAVLGAMTFSGRVGDPGYVAVTKTVTGANGQSHVETVVTVINTETGAVADTWVPLAGQAVYFAGPAGGADGDRFYLVTSAYHPSTDSNSTTIAAYSAAHGAAIGEPVTLDGPWRSLPVIGPDGTRMLQAYGKWDPQTRQWVGTVAVINTHVPSIAV